MRTGISIEVTPEDRRRLERRRPAHSGRSDCARRHGVRMAMHLAESEEETRDLTVRIAARDTSLRALREQLDEQQREKKKAMFVRV